MTRTPDSNTEKLNELYEEITQLEKELTFLATKINLLQATASRNATYEVVGDKTLKNIKKAQVEIDAKVKRYGEVQAEIDALDDL